MSGGSCPPSKPLREGVAGRCAASCHRKERLREGRCNIPFFEKTRCEGEAEVLLSSRLSPTNALGRLPWSFSR